jgi:hypothetical protein
MKYVQYETKYKQNAKENHQSLNIERESRTFYKTHRTRNQICLQKKSKPDN